MAQPLRQLAAECFIRASDDFVNLPKGEIPTTLQTFLYETYLSMCSMYTSIRVMCRLCQTSNKNSVDDDSVKDYLLVCSKCVETREYVPATWGRISRVSLNGLEYYIDSSESQLMEVFICTSKKKAETMYVCENCGKSCVNIF